MQQTGRSVPREKDYIRKDGSRVSVLIASALFSKEPLQGISFILDLTQQRLIEDQLRQAQKMEIVGQLTGGVAHDFNNLLLVILGSAEALAEDLAESPKLESLAQLTLTAAMRGAELTNRLLAFARRQPLQPTSADVNSLLSGMEGLLRRTLQEAIDIEIAGDPALWSCIVDVAALESAILNLAINARDAMPGGGHLTIETTNVEVDATYAATRPEVQPGNYVLIAITDDGIGMTPEVAERAFEPFFSTKPAGKGSGLGLSMVYGFVKQSGGHISLYSEPGKGTTVRLYLPRADSAARWEPARGVSLSIPAGKGETVLLVEDNDLVRSFSEMQLRNLGYKVTTAADGAAALDALKRDRFDLLFTDVILPGTLNGPRLAEAAKQLQPGIKVLYASGYTENAIVHHGRLDVGVELISKPYSRPTLARRLRQILEEK
jgi:signal transduction histidine kinase